MGATVPETSIRQAGKCLSGCGQPAGRSGHRRRLTGTDFEGSQSFIPSVSRSSGGETLLGDHVRLTPTAHRRVGRLAPQQLVRVFPQLLEHHFHLLQLLADLGAPHLHVVLLALQLRH